MIASATDGWSDLFVACAGAGAALAGLVVVAVSINIDRILSIKGLPERGLATLLLLLEVVVVSIIGLVPDQSDTALGAEILATGLIAAVAIARLVSKIEYPPGAPRSWRIGHIGIAASGTTPIVIGGAIVLAGGDGGLYWVFAGLVLAIVGAVMNAWVLLVEILR